MGELKAGCKALVVGGFYRTNDGKSVDVVKFIRNGEVFEFDGQMYQDKPPRGDAWLITGDLVAQVNGEANRVQFALIPGAYLMPIDGQPEESEFLSREAV